MTRTKLQLLVGALFGLCSGCTTSLFNARGAYDSQACVEESLRRNPRSPDAVAAAIAMDVACREGDPAACSVHGLMLQLGAGTAEDGARARALFTHACGAGNQNCEGNWIWRSKTD